jgi:hypothetical protein
VQPVGWRCLRLDLFERNYAKQWQDDQHLPRIGLQVGTVRLRELGKRRHRAVEQVDSTGLGSQVHKACLQVADMRLVERVVRQRGRT